MSKCQQNECSVESFALSIQPDWLDMRPSAALRFTYKRKSQMAKNGFKVFDSDMHIMEPPDLWERYIDAEFRAQAPRGRTSENVRDLGTIFPTIPKDSRRTGGT